LSTPRATADLAQGPIRWAQEIFERKNLSYLDEALAHDFVSHTAQGGEPPGPQSYKGFMAFLLHSYPDANVTVDDVIVAGNKVVARWTMRGTNTGRAFNMEPTGKRVEYSGVNISRVDNDGRIAEMWTYVDTMTMMRQLGVPLSAQPPVTSQADITAAVADISPT
jgi:steroid delta-isomerase-like uncharacterized protein